MAIIFDGNKFAAEKLSLLKERVEKLPVKPLLVSVVFREDSMGMLYTKLKAQAAGDVGIGFEKVEISRVDPLAEIVKIVMNTCNRDEVSGVLVQKPRQLPPGWWEEITSAIDTKKDVDCLTRVNLDKVYRGESDFLPATAKAVVSILETVVGSIKNLLGKDIAVVGRSELVGRPLAYYLKGQMLKVKMLGSKDSLALELTHADVVVSATGEESLIRGEMVKEGAVVIDVGEPKGDVDFTAVSPKVAFITPVPGGVGPVTVVSLLSNLVDMVEYRD